MKSKTNSVSTRNSLFVSVFPRHAFFGTLVLTKSGTSHRMHPPHATLGIFLPNEVWPHCIKGKTCQRVLLSVS